MEDFPEKQRDLISKLAYVLNQFGEDVLGALDRNLSIEDNLTISKKDITVTVDNAGVPIGNLVIKSDLATTCVGMQVIKVLNLTNSVPTTAVISGNSAANPTVVTTTVVHGLSSGDEIIISGSDSTPTINGRWLASVVSSTTFSLPLTCSGAGTVGTVTRYNTPRSTPFLTFSDNSGAITVSRITSLLPNQKYQLKLILYP